MRVLLFTATVLGLIATHGCSSEVECEVTLTCACESDDQCERVAGDVAECEVAVCLQAGHCGTEPLAAGAPCSAGACDGDGTCMPLAQGGGGVGGDGGDGGGGIGGDGGGGTPPTALKVVAGQFHACALMSDSSVFCWGGNTYGELGDGTTLERSMAAPVNGLSDATQIEAGGIHTCALRNGGTVVCWGNNDEGQLGDTTNDDRTEPVAVNGLSGAIHIDVGGGHTCAAVTGGRAMCWGSNYYGELGDEGTTPSNAPIETDVLNARIVGTSATLGNHSCAVNGVNTQVTCWGNDQRGQLGSGTITGVDDLALGSDFTCALYNTDVVRCWGGNNQGTLGNGVPGNSDTPVNVSGVTTAVDIDAGTSHACAVLEGGAVRCWGRNTYGQLGDGTSGNIRDEPVAVIGMSDAVSVAAGDDFSCAVHQSGGVSCWGRNIFGQLGDGTGNPSETPVAVTGLP